MQEETKRGTEGNRPNRIRADNSTSASSWTHAVKGTDPVRMLTSLYRNLMILVKDYNMTTRRSGNEKKSLDEVFKSILETEAN